MSCNVLQEVGKTSVIGLTSYGNLQNMADGILSPWNARLSYVGSVGDVNLNNLSEWVKIRNARG